MRPYKRRLSNAPLIRRCLFLTAVSMACTVLFAMDVPIEPYVMPAQRIKTDFVQERLDEAPLMSSALQQKKYHDFYQHMYASDEQGLSPWSEAFVRRQIVSEYVLPNHVLMQWSNDPPHYGENYHRHGQRWFKKIHDQMNLEAFHPQQYQAERRAITVTNTLARLLPVHEPDFFASTRPGQGFPFDTLQASALFAGTPVYVAHTTQDKSWSLVLTPDNYMAWIPSHDLAYVSDSFIQTWQTMVKRGLGAVVKTRASIFNAQEQYVFSGYLGAVFPLVKQGPQKTQIGIPVKDSHHQARRAVGFMATDAMETMPQPLTKKNMLRMMDQLHHRPYGWGGAFFFNDCSQEMKSLFTPFGLWLPRSSALQAQSAHRRDFSSQSDVERLNALKELGHPFMTLIYVGGHIMLYLGLHHEEAITYQNVWGLPSLKDDKRYVIGQSVFLPLRLHDPRNPNVRSLMNKEVFWLIDLDR